MIETAVFKEIVFVGGGHTHALVLRQWAMNPLPGVRLTLISPQPMTPYSGMLPGLIAGHYTFEQTHIDLVKLALWANIRFIQDKVIAIDTHTQTLTLQNRPEIEYDVVSIDIGSTPAQVVKGAAQYSTSVKPISDFYQRFQLIQDKAQNNKIKSIAVVGGGAGSVEVVLALAYRINGATSQVKFHLITAADNILSGYHAAVIKSARKQLEKYGIDIHTGARVKKLSQDRVYCQNGSTISVDEVFWCTQASGASWLQVSQLDCDKAGFVKVRQTLQTLTDDRVFAAGDIAHMLKYPRPKAGVYAVRQAPTLFHNLRAILLNQSLLDYKPQDGFLSLLALGEKKATGAKFIFSFTGDWVWRWKDFIDHKFMKQFHQLPELDMELSVDVDSQLLDESEKMEQHDPSKRCGGCGAKLGMALLEDVINLVLGEDYYQPQDAVLISNDAQSIYQSVDLLKSPLQDPYLFGKIAVNHALSDLYAMNLVPDSAQLLISLPYAGQKVQRRQLKMLMQGISEQLLLLNCHLLGGHSSESNELSVGLVVNGKCQGDHVFHKQGLKAGDKLVLSKPLGTGLILAAAMQNRCEGKVYNQAIYTMLEPNYQAAKILEALNIKACTDVTGFGLLGHLYELCKASSCSAQIQLHAIPLLAGAEELAKQQIKSSLYLQNRQILNKLDVDAALINLPRFDLLFDPQTSGGLLAAVPAQQYETLKSHFHSQFYLIGEVITQKEDRTAILIQL